MANGDFIPARKPASLTLQPGERRTAWPDLDPATRALFFGETLAAHPDWTVTGAVDYASPLEPILRDGEGRLITLDGRPVSRPLAVDITEGTLIAGLGRDQLLLLALAGVGLVLLASG